MKAHVFYVEDDETLAFLTKDNLEQNDFEVSHFGDGEVAWNAFKEGEYDICVLDVMLPKIDGFTLAKQIRSMNDSIPIIFLTAKTMKEDKLSGLTLGGDDYLTKPFSIEELMLKLDIFLRRKNIVTPSHTDIFDVGDHSKLDAKNLILHRESGEKDLTQKESDLLKMFAENKGSTLKRSVILEKIWGTDDYFLGRSLDVFISRLRKYLSEDETVKIENVHGVGFRLIAK